MTIANNVTVSLGPVDLRLPPDPHLSRVVRLAASGMASLAGFAVDQIEDIKIAVSEILIALIEHGAGNVIDLQLWVADDAFSMRGRTAVTAFDANHPDLRLCRTVLDGVTGHNRIELLDDHATIWAAVPRTAG